MDDSRAEKAHHSHHQEEAVSNDNIISPAPVGVSVPIHVPVETSTDATQKSFIESRVLSLSSTMNELKPYIPTRLLKYYHVIYEKRWTVLFGVSVLTAITPTRVALLYLIRSLISGVLRAVGTAIGVGFGLGFALHIAETLQSFHNGGGSGGSGSSGVGGGVGMNMDMGMNHSEKEVQKRTSPFNSTRNDRDRDSEEGDDSSSYRSLMASAGYHVPKGILRGQILRNVSPTTAALYDYDARKKGSDVNEEVEERHKHGLYSFPSIIHGEGGEKGLATFQRNFTQLPSEVQTELGKFVDYVVRDYVTSWYCSVDDGVRYVPELGRVQNGGKERQTSIQGSKTSDSNEDHELVQNQAATMVLSLTPSRSIPLLEIVYSGLVHVIGNLSMFAADNVNVAELVLSKFMHILKVNIRVYRELRKIAQRKGEAEKGGYDYSVRDAKKYDASHTKQRSSSDVMDSGDNGVNETTSPQESTRMDQFDLPPPPPPSRSASTASTATTSSNHNTTSSKSRQMRPPSEVAIVREYLLQGKLHRAITFGMDVPGLLFGDKNGTECEMPSSYNDANIHQATCFDERLTQEEKILSQRLFGRNGRIMNECQLDYHRLIAHRLGRILFPRTDFTSPLMKAASVEMVAGCVLAPMFQCATPDYVNSWIIGAMEDVDVEMSLDMQSKAEIEQGKKLSKVTVSNELGTSSREFCTEDDEEEDDGYADGDEEDEKSYFNEGSSEKDFIGCVPSNSEDELRILSSTTRSEDTYEDALPLENKSDEEVTIDEVSDILMTLLSMSLIEFQAHIDFEEMRHLRAGNEDEYFVDWNDPGCRLAGQHLVLVLEAMLIHGKLNQRRRKRKSVTVDKSSGESGPVSESIFPPLELGYMEESSLEVVLMKVTSDLESFEERCTREEKKEGTPSHLESQYESDDEPISNLSIQNNSELTTLRSLIAAWLHTGSAYRTVALLVSSVDRVLHPFYHKNAFIRNSENVNDFLTQLHVLRDVEILVDTPPVDSVPPLNLCNKDADVSKFVQSISKNSQILEKKNRVGTRDINVPRGKNNSSHTQERRHRIGLGGLKANLENNRKRLANVASSLVAKESSLPSVATPIPSNTPSHLRFRRNDAFASSLRQDRQRRMKSFSELCSGRKTSYDMICRGRGATEQHVKEHLEIHGLAALFFRNINMLLIRHSSGSNRNIEKDCNTNITSLESVLATEYLSRQRKYDVPEVDSNFLLRIKPRNLQIVRTHRDQQNIDHSYYQFAAFYDEPLLHPLSKGYRGARLRKKCYLRFYPTDRTALVSLLNDNRYSDLRKGKDNIINVLTLPPSSSPILTKDFQKMKHLCHKAFGKGSERSSGALSSTLLANTLMDTTDFSFIPRTGRAVDFVYKMSLFECPEVELSGKTFLVQDASILGPLRADASSLELSDASLSTALLMSQPNGLYENFCLKVADDGSPMIEVSLREMGSDTNTSLTSSDKINCDDKSRSFRTSFVRAALLVKSAKDEARLQCMLSCIKSGSQKSSGRPTTKDFLQPTLGLLDFASSKKREKQSILLRDLKLGINHIDREQLRRNGLFNPRFPTMLRQIKVYVESGIQVKSNPSVDLLGSTSSVFYKIRCIAVTEHIDVQNIDQSEEGSNDGRKPRYGDLIREQWVVLRSFREFSALHKFLKTQVSASESSGGAGAKIVGAATGLATAAFTIGGNNSAMHSKRKMLIPSLSQASKAVSIGSTKKFIEKRREILNEYLTYLLSPGNLLNRCPELLRFVGAYDPLPAKIEIGASTLEGFTDNLGRCEMNRAILERKSTSYQTSMSSQPISIPRTPLDNNTRSDKTIDESTQNKKRSDKKQNRKGRTKKELLTPAKLAMLSSIQSRIERVKLNQVRANVFDLLRFTFDLDNASFLRNQMVSGLKTMVIAFSSGQDLRKTLLDFHVNYLSGKCIASYIKYGRDKIWPGGVLFESAPELSPREKIELENSSRSCIHNSFPDQLKHVLGNEITNEGLDLLHEMLQNRVVLKSMMYMMFDTVLLEMFPELDDILTCSQVLDNANVTH